MTVERLAEMLDVTLQTMRRDVRKLSDGGMLARFHGGVRLPGSTTEHRPPPARGAKCRRQGAHRRGGSGGGAERLIADPRRRHPTIEAVAQALLHRRGLRVITYNLHMATILRRNEACEAIVAGGAARGRDLGIIGKAAADFIRQFKVDIALIGISGIESDDTLRDFDYREAKVAQTIIRQAREVWLAADSNKFQRAAMVELATLSQIDRLSTDAEPPEPFPTLLAEAQVAYPVA